jgi:flagellar hook-basal body complex protein FliE
MAISPTNPAIQQALDAGRITVPTPQAGPQKGEDFAHTLMDVMKEVNTSQQQAGQMQDDFISGRRPVEYHDLMISMEKASTTLQLTMAVRNKVLDAYQEIDRMQV